MAIFERISDLVRANINDLIDRAENPEKMVKQIIIDMEEQLRKATQGLAEYIIEKGYNGIVIEALGRGNVPPMMISGIKEALDKGIPVVIVSRCFEGRVYESYGYEGGGKMLKDLGVILEDNMPGQKARIKLLVELSEKRN